MRETEREKTCTGVGRSGGRRRQRDILVDSHADRQTDRRRERRDSGVNKKMKEKNY